MTRWLPQQWYRITGWHLLLWPLSLLFGLLAALRRSSYRLGLLRAWRAPVPVIVVGNISVGGTGKTPLTLWLAQWLRAHGLRPGIISRGYGAGGRRPRRVLADDSAADVGDEPLLLARRAGCPVWVGQRRAAAAQCLLAASPECDVLISDDGLQHYALARDVEIAVVDGTRRYGNGLLLPAGPLREPLARLSGVDAVVVNGGSARADEFAMTLTARAFRNVADALRTAVPTDFAGRRLQAVAGIGNPPRFFRQLQEMGLDIVPHAFADHHAFQWADLAFAAGEPLVMTEKDAVKCRAFAQPDWWYLEVDAHLDDALGSRVLRKLRK